MSLAFAACGHSNNSPTPTPSSTVTAVPTASSAASAAATPCAISLGLAYEPDAGNGGSLHGIQYTHFEDNNENLCPSSAVSPSPALVTFSSSVGGVAFASDASAAVALLEGASGGYTLVQDIFGTSVGTLTPVGSPYDISVEPTSAPTGVVSPSATATSTATPPSAPLITDAQSVAILGGSAEAVALVLGTPATASTPAIVALTSLTNAPPQYGNAVPFSGSSYTLTSIPATPRNIVRVGVDASNIVALARGQQDLLAFKVTVVATGYRFDATAEDASLGTNTLMRGSGAIAFDPADVTRALIGGTSSAGQGNVLTLVTGLPGAITKTTSIALPGATQIRSIAITTAGVYALVATDVGIFSVGGVNGTTLLVVPPFSPNPAAPSAIAPSYLTCNATTAKPASAQMTNVASVGISSDAKYLVALGTGSGVSCASGYNDAIVAVPYNPASGSTPSPVPSSSSTSTPGPTTFVQNNIIAPPTGSDLMYVH